MSGLKFSEGRRHGRYVDPRPDIFEAWLAACLKGDGYFPNGRRRRAFAVNDCRLTRDKAEQIFIKLFRKKYGREPTQQQL